MVFEKEIVGGVSVVERLMKFVKFDLEICTSKISGGGKRGSWQELFTQVQAFI